MSQHLRSHHNLKGPTTSVSPTGSSQGTMNRFFQKSQSTSPRATARTAKAKLARRICLHLNCRLMLPFSIVNSDAFYDFLNETQVVKFKSEMPGRTMVSTTALEEICGEFEDGIKTFFRLCDPVAIATSFDLWSDSHAHNKYMNLSVHFLDKMWNLHCVNLGTEQFESPHTAVRIEEHINKKLEFYSLDHLVNISVKDNGANVVAASRNMALRTGLTRENIDDFTCYAHNIHLLLMTDLLKDPQCDFVRGMLKKVKKSHRALAFRIPEMRKRNIIESSLQLQNFFVTMEETITEILDVEDDDVEVDLSQARAPVPSGGVSFKPANDTRWDSTRVLLETRRANEGKFLGCDVKLKLVLIIKIFSSAGLINKMLVELDKAELILNREETTLVHELEKLLDVFSEATKSLQSRSQPTINLLFATSSSMRKK